MNDQIYSKVGHGQDIVFLHGWKQDRHTWDSAVESLKQDFTCWTLDLPGFGQNAKPKDAWNPMDYAAYVADFITEKKIKKPTVIGHSFGGRVAICLASDVLKFKIENLKLILYATPGFREPLPRFTSMAQAFARTTKSWIPLHKMPIVSHIRTKMQSRDFKEAEDMHDIFLATIEYNLSDAMTKINTPTLLIWGEDDAEVPLKIGVAMLEAIPNAELKTIPKTGHFAHQENPGLFAGIVRNFIQTKA